MRGIPFEHFFNVITASIEDPFFRALTSKIRLPGSLIMNSRIHLSPGFVTVPEKDSIPQMGDFSQQNGSATCTYTNEFTLSETVNAFSGVTDIRHSLEDRDGQSVCSVCGTIIGDDGTEIEPKEPINLGWLIHLGVFLAGAVTASAVFTAVLLIRRKKKA